MTLYSVVMAGGSGTRFWPYSRREKPKQLLKLFSDKTMINETVERLTPLIPLDRTYIATNKRLADQIRPELPGVNYVIEPIPKNTAACIGLSALTLIERDPEAIMFIETSDHVYDDTGSYLDMIKKAVIKARQGKIVLLGITPTFPHTGLGYIQTDGLTDEDVPDSYNVKCFKEKPDIKTAKEFLESGDYLWNAGVFIAKCSVMLEEIEKHMPALYQGLMQIKQNDFSEDVISDVFNNLESISIDYGVMEKTEEKVVIRAGFHWDDIGDFLSLERVYPKDEKKNVALCNFEGNAQKCILLSQTRKIIANGIQELVIVDTPDATLICNKTDVQNIKRALDKIRDADLAAYLEDIVADHTKAIVALESEDCEVETDGLIVLMNVDELSIIRTETELKVDGAEEL